MQEQWLPISDIPVQGREFYFEDEREWIAICNTVISGLKLSGKMTAFLGVFPQEHGVFFRGLIKGFMTAPCFRCLEPGMVNLDHSFELFEDFHEDSRESSGSEILKFDNGQWLVNLSQVIREQLVLALPDKILCRDECLGICPECGHDLNTDMCGCVRGMGDPRLAVLKNIQIKTH